jgi:hypothetical protein
MEIYETAARKNEEDQSESLKIQATRYIRSGPQVPKMRLGVSKMPSVHTRQLFVSWALPGDSDSKKVSKMPTETTSHQMRK